MNNPILSVQLTLEPNDNRRLAKLCGPFDEHLRQIESRLGVKIKNRGNRFQFDGIDDTINMASLLIESLYLETEKNIELSPEYIHLHLQEAGMTELTRSKTSIDSKGKTPTASQIIDNDKPSIQTRRKLIILAGLINSIMLPQSVITILILVSALWYRQNMVSSGKRSRSF